MACTIQQPQHSGNRVRRNKTMSKTILKNGAGLYYVEGSGFTASSPSAATAMSSDQADCTIKCAAKFGTTGVVTESAPASVSYAVCYVRNADRQADGSIVANVNNPSRRRFASEAGARTHGARFHVRKARWGAAPGTAGHVGFYVIKTNDPVNAFINLKTGLTNPAKGYVRPR